VVADIPETRYAKTVDGAHIAFQVVGDGLLDLILPQVGSNVDLAWEMPTYARVFRRLASFSRLIRLDTRGSGLSDPLGFSELPSLEQQANEMLAVLDSAGSERAAILGNETGGLVAIFFAASYPNRTSALVLDGCYARLARGEDNPWGVPTEVLDQALAFDWGASSSPAASVRPIAPRALQDPEFASQLSRYYRSVHGPSSQRARAEMAVYADVRPLLPAIQAPTLVLYRSGDRFAGKPHAAYLAEHIRDAKLVEVPGDENLLFVRDSDADLAEIEEFLTGVRHTPETHRVLATVVFTDIVGSTERAAQLGDRAWRELLDAHDGVVRRQLERFRGREVNTMGDGFVATFDGPGRAIECACAIRDALSSLEIDVRSGLHTGEIELRGDDVAGIAVHIAQRVSALAAPRQVLVSRTVTDLVVGSGIQFADRGEHELRGVPGTWHLYSVVA
jgi:class 3 adenylate cyclase